MSSPGTKEKGGDRREGVNKPAASDTAPIKTPDPTDTQDEKPPAETPKVGSQDAPGG
ncbi:MAG: hypothetical protein JOZ93_02455 [Sinobacteraceae bacterium]|nr:hypothetical protein [Nevskiaceae bacterium]